jgi:hypothetical protein
MASILEFRVFWRASLLPDCIDPPERIEFNDYFGITTDVRNPSARAQQGSAHTLVEALCKEYGFKLTARDTPSDDNLHAAEGAFWSAVDGHSRYDLPGSSD